MTDHQKSDQNSWIAPWWLAVLLVYGLLACFYGAEMLFLFNMSGFNHVPLATKGGSNIMISN